MRESEDQREHPDRLRVAASAWAIGQAVAPPQRLLLGAGADAGPDTLAHIAKRNARQWEPRRVLRPDRAGTIRVAPPARSSPPTRDHGARDRRGAGPELG